MDIIPEKWLPVPGWPKYEASTHGRIRRGERVRKLSHHDAGYQFVTLSDGKRIQTFLVHRLVAVTFLGPIPEGQEVNHIDGNKHHNWVTNLEYLTRSANIVHAIRTGLNRLVGAENPMAKLSEADVLAIKAEHVPLKVGYKQIAARYGVCPECIRNIIKGRSWQSANGGSSALDK